MSAPEKGPDPFDTLLAKDRLVVCVGTGGVGKTTLSAAIAIESARRGLDTLVLTVDPARRLADALDLASLPSTPVAIPDARRKALGLGPEAGTLSALALDPESSFDELVNRLADSEETRQRILENPIYRNATRSLAGSAEYAAIERVYELSEDGRFDCIVLDTPPAHNALDFLDAPRRLLEFLDSRVVQLLVQPALSVGRFGFGLFQRGTRRAFQLVERVTGVDFLGDLSEFLMLAETLSERLGQRARAARELLWSPQTRFVLVSGPSADGVNRARRFLARLEEVGVRSEGVIVNRQRAWPGGGTPPEGLFDEAARRAGEQALADVLPGENPAFAAHAAMEAVAGYASLVHEEQRQSNELGDEARSAGRFFRVVPELEGEVHDVESLALVHRALFPAAGSAAAGTPGPATGSPAPTASTPTPATPDTPATPASGVEA